MWERETRHKNPTARPAIAEEISETNRQHILALESYHPGALLQSKKGLRASYGIVVPARQIVAGLQEPMRVQRMRIGIGMPKTGTFFPCGLFYDRQATELVEGN